MLVTKSGTNQLHGSAYEYNRTNFGHANDFFNKTAQLQAGLPNKAPALIRNTFGASLGGPIKKDKLFFFLNYEGQRTAENKQVTQTVPTQSLRDGNLKYLDTNGNVVTLCSGASISKNACPNASPKDDLAAMDPNCPAAGNVAKQDPAANTPAQSGSTVRLWLVPQPSPSPSPTTPSPSPTTPPTTTPPTTTPPPTTPPSPSPS